MKTYFKLLILLVSVGCSKEALVSQVAPSQRLSATKNSTTVVPAFYISPGGSDSNPGTFASPFQTLERARDTMRVSTIKTAYLLAGTYLRSTTLFLTVADNDQLWQTYPGDAVNSAIVDGNYIQDVIDILGGNNITIDGLTVQNYTSRGIGVHGGTGWRNAAPNFDVTYGIAANNTISNNIVENGVVPNPGWDRAGINTEGNTPNTHIYNNVVRNTGGYGIGVWSLQTGDNTSGTEIKNNVLLNTCTNARDGAAIYTIDRARTCTGILIQNNYIRDYGIYASYLRAVYLDDMASNVTVTGNIFAGNGRQPALINGGSNNVFTGNIIDLGAIGKQNALNYADAGRGTTVAMTGNKFNNNIILSSYPVDSAGGAFLKSGTRPDPEIINNFYFNYSTGIVNTGGLSYLLYDKFPQGRNPNISGWEYTIAAGSPVYNSPVSFPPIVGGWGPTGYSIPHTGMLPSCLATGSNFIYCQAESYNGMSGVTLKTTTINSCDNGEWVAFNNVDLGAGCSTLVARLAVPAANAGKSVQIRSGSTTGTLLGTLTTTSTGAWNAYQEQSTTLTGANGIQNIYFVFAGGSGVGNFDYFKFY